MGQSSHTKQGRYRRLFETTADAIFVADADSREIVDANPAAADLLGTPVDELLGEPVETVHPADERDAYRELFERFKREPAVVEDGLHVETHDGDRIPVEITASSFEVDDRTLVQGTVRDITHRVELEADLRAQRERYRKIFRNSNDAIFVVDPHEDEILDCNQRACNLLGYEKDELLEQSVSDVHPDEMGTFREFADEVFAEGEGWTDELTCLTKSGDRIPSLLAASTFELDGRTAILGCVQEVAAQKRRERALEELQATARELLSAHSRRETARLTTEAVSRVLGTPRSTVWLKTSHGFERAAATREAESSGLPAFENVDDLLTDAYDGSAASVVVQLETPPRDPGVEPISSAVLAPLGSHGVLSVGLTDEDLSAPDRRFVEILAANVEAALDRTSHEEQLKQQADQLAVLNRLVRHDIRNDVMLLRATVEDARADADEAVASTLARALADAEHIAELTDTVGDLVKVVAEDATPEMYPVDLAGVIRTEVERATDAHEHASISLSVTGEPTVRANAMLDSVFRNLLNNAVEHNGSADPQVDILVTVDDDRAAVCVVDDGPGVPDSQKEGIFGRGEQGLESSGVGLGLYLVEQLTGQFGGDTWVQDDLPDVVEQCRIADPGAVFCVSLPLSDS